MYKTIYTFLVIAISVILLQIYIYYYNDDTFNVYKSNTKFIETSHIDKVNQLNKLWNSKIDNYEDSIIFLHSFDTITGETLSGEWNGYCNKNTNFPWCPKSYASLMNFCLPFPLKIPVKGVSFSAFNKNILPKKGEIIFNGDNASGLVFDFYNNKSKEISPLCYFPTDGMTVIRNQAGCGKLGFQFSNIDFNKDGYNLNGTGNLHTEKAFTHSTYLSFILQSSINYNKFINKVSKNCSIQRKKLRPINVSSLNEVVFKSWLGADFNLVPLTAFFHMKDCTEEVKNNIKKISSVFKQKVKRDIPIVSFDPKSKNPFKISDVNSNFCDYP